MKPPESCRPSHNPSTEAHIWRCFRDSSPRRLRCGVLLSAPGVEKWAAAALALLAADPEVVIESVFIFEGAGRDTLSQGGALFQRLQAWSSLRSAPLSRTALDLPAGASQVALKLESGALAPEDATRLRERGLDVLISLESEPLPADCSSLARHGVWSIWCGDPVRPLSTPPYWREVWQREPVSTAVLRQQLPRRHA